MLNGELYLVGIEMSTNEYVENANCCAMCKKLIINAGIKTVYIRINSTEYKTIDVNLWVDNDESLSYNLGY